LTLAPSGIAQANSKPQWVEVMNLHDSGNGSLRAAITKADTERTTKATSALITFSSNLSGSIDLQSPLPDVTQSVHIDGPGARKITLDAAAISRLGRVDAPALFDETPYTELTISGLTMSQASDVDLSGAWLYVVSADLTLDRDTFAQNRSTRGGGALSARHSHVTIDGCTFTNNRAHYGGAANTYLSTVKVEDSTFVDNHATDEGGALTGSTGVLDVVDSTVTGNSVDYTGTATTYPYGYGGGIAVVNNEVLGLYDSIVAGNSASGNVHHKGHRYGGSNHGDVFVDNSYLHADFSLIEHDTKSLKGVNSTDILGRSPDLGPLRDNGGETNTELPLLDSPVINAGRAFGLKADQRGAKRTVDYPGVKKRKGSDETDIGAVELQAPERHR
jgi:hypothetical protein